MFCTLCKNKTNGGLFKCEGCLQTFCLQHTNEHRHYLQSQLNELIRARNRGLLELDGHNQTSILFDKINQWERESIEKIREAARAARVEVDQIFKTQKEQTKQKFNQIGTELEKAFKTNEYFEKDLYRWIILLEQLQYDINVLSPSIILQQDISKPFIKNINVVKKDPQATLNDSLVSESNALQFDSDHHIVMHCGPDRTAAYATGTQEYESGRHQIRLFVSKKTSEFSLSFNIMSKSMQKLTNSPDSQFLTYGWQSDDCVIPSLSALASPQNVRDLKGHTEFHLALLINCDERKLSYYNEKTKQTREINVDIEKCPLPWKLFFYLYDIGDCVRLLSSFEMP